jgi:hypothetical protein
LTVRALGAANRLFTVIPEVDESLHALLVAAVPDVTAFTVRLTTIREDTAGLPANWADLRDDRGVVVARRPPIRRYELRYTVNAAAADSEHRLLDAMLAAISATATIDPPHLHDHFTDCGLPVLIRLDEPSPLAVDRPLGLDLVVTAPMLLAWTADVAPPPAEVELAASRSVSRPAPVARPARPLRARRISEDV